MLKSTISNNSPGHSHNEHTFEVGLSSDICPGNISKRNNKMKIYKIYSEITGKGVAFHTDLEGAKKTREKCVNKESIKIKEIEIHCKTKEEALKQGFLYLSETI